MKPDNRGGTQEQDGWLEIELKNMLNEIKATHKGEKNPKSDEAGLEARLARIKSELEELDQERQLRRSRESSLTPKRRRSSSRGNPEDRAPGRK